MILYHRHVPARKAHIDVPDLVLLEGQDALVDG